MSGVRIRVIAIAEGFYILQVSMNAARLLQSNQISVNFGHSPSTPYEKQNHNSSAS